MTVDIGRRQHGGCSTKEGGRISAEDAFAMCWATKASRVRWHNRQAAGLGPTSATNSTTRMLSFPCWPARKPRPPQPPRSPVSWRTPHQRVKMASWARRLDGAVDEAAASAYITRTSRPLAVGYLEPQRSPAPDASQARCPSDEPPGSRARTHAMQMPMVRYACCLAGLWLPSYCPAEMEQPWPLTKVQVVATTSLGWRQRRAGARLPVWAACGRRDPWRA